MGGLRLRSRVIGDDRYDSATQSGLPRRDDLRARGNVAPGAQSDGRVGGDGAYLKPSGVGIAHQGAVYAVAGSSGQIGGGPLNHPVMVVALNVLGSMILDIDDKRLDATFLDDQGLTSPGKASLRWRHT